MTGTVVDFLEELRNVPVPDGFGLLFVDPARAGRDVIQIDNPRFMLPLPVGDMERCRRLLIVSRAIGDLVVSELNAQPIETMNYWYRYAMWDESRVGGD